MLTLLFAALVLGHLAWMLRHRPAAAIAGVFLLFTLVTRTLSLVYVDLAGPLYADQLGETIGGDASMPLFATSVLTVMLCLAWAFAPQRVRLARMPPPHHSTAARFGASLVLGLLGLFVLAVYIDMLTRGPVPLLAGIDRLDYNQDMAGVLHPLLFDFGFLIAGTAGALFVLPRLRGRDFDFRFFALYLAVLLYYALTGHRFSAFYSFTSFFVIPLAALPLVQAAGRLPPAPRARPTWKAFLCSRAAAMLALLLGLLAVLGLLLNSVIGVRGYDDPWELLFQRTLVQPVELWWATWRDLDQRLGASVTEAWQALFVNPIDPTRNTSIQMLMIKNLGDERALELLDIGQQYTGGYPEVLFELLPASLALPVGFVFALIAALLLRLTVVSVALGRLATAFMALYVYFGFSLLFIGGMLNFLLAWTFWLKCGLLIVVYVGERLLERRVPRVGGSPLPAP
jgi:hypothetical protein